MRAAAALVVLAARLAHADDAAPENRDDAAWHLYNDAFAALAHGDRDKARALVGQLEREHGDHPATKLARDALTDTLTPEPPPLIEPATSGARAELALVQTLNGMSVGVEICVALDCKSATAGIGVTLAGATIGAIASLQVDHVTSGTRALINSGAFWGAFDAAMIDFATHPTTARGASLLVAGQTAGVITGALMATQSPTGGQVALSNSGGTWAAVVTGLTLLWADDRLTGDGLAISLAVSADLGLVAGGYVAQQLPRVSRTQTLVIDAGAIVGGVAGGGLGTLITGSVTDRATAGIAAFGVLAGIAAATYFTRDWHSDEVPAVTAGLAPAKGGALVTAGFTW